MYSLAHLERSTWRKLLFKSICLAALFCCCILCSHISELFGQFQFNVWLLKLLTFFLNSNSVYNEWCTLNGCFISRRYSPSSPLSHCQTQIHANWVAFVRRNWVIFQLYSCILSLMNEWIERSEVLSSDLLPLSLYRHFGVSFPPMNAYAKQRFHNSIARFFSFADFNSIKRGTHRLQIFVANVLCLCVFSSLDVKFIFNKSNLIEVQVEWAKKVRHHHHHRYNIYQKAQV